MNKQENHNTPYPIADAIPKEQLEAEAETLERLAGETFLVRLMAYLKLGGPGFLGAAMTLGAGTVTTAMLSGAQFGYKTLWISWVAMGSGVFMMMAMARFTTKGQILLIREQSKQHGWLIGRVMTALLAIVFVCVVFNFGQVALGTHLIETIAAEMNVNFSQEVNWIAYGLISAVLTLSYGRGGKGVALVEFVMKLGILIMLLSLVACLFVVGIDFTEAVRGFFVPWLPSGRIGVDLFIASYASTASALSWVFFHYAGHAKGWGPRHEPLARVDIFTGLVLPFILIYVVVVSVFAGTLYGSGSLPSTAADLSHALIPLLGDSGAQYAFLAALIAVPITSSVLLGIACGIGMHEAFGWEPDVKSARWKICVLMPQIALIAAWAPSPVFLIVAIAAFLSLTNNIVGWSFYLLLNDKAVLGEHRSRSYGWNFGILTQITFLNCIAIMWVFNRLGFWE